MVLLRVRVEVVVIEVLRAVVLLESRDQASSILVVRDTTTIVDDASHIDESFPRDLILFVQEDLEHRERGLQIRVIELISDVPAERSELSSLLEDGVEE